MALIRSLLFVAWLYGSMAVIGILFIPTLLMPRGAAHFGIRIFVRTVRFGLRWICGIKTEVRGLENLPEGNFIYAPKHQAMWDTLFPFLILYRPAMIMKQELLWYPAFGWYALKTRQISIDRDGTVRTLKKMVREAVVKVGRNRPIVIFPEGTRGKPGETLPYHAAGISALYKELQIPVVPVATNSGQCWPGRGIIRTPGTIVFEILPPIAPGLKRRELMERLENTIEPASRALLSINAKADS